jgi:poly [ADP-ribose] polymerase 16
MFSILNYGLNQHLNKTGLFGEGLYFARELGEFTGTLKSSRKLNLADDFPFLDVSLLFSPAVLGWNKSKIGDVVSVVAVCEYIDDPNFVKVRKGENSFHPLNPSQASPFQKTPKTPTFPKAIC